MSNNQDFAEDKIDEVEEETTEQPEGDEEDSESDESGEPEGAPEHEEELAPAEAHSKQSDVDPIKNKFNQLRREKYNLINRINELESKLVSERGMTDLSNQAMQKHYEDSIYQRLDQAKTFKAQAIESGDVKQQIEADEALAAAVGEVQAHKKWQAEQEFVERQREQSKQQQQQQQQYNQPPEVAYQQQLHQYQQQWASERPYLNPNNPQYDSKLGTAIDTYARQLTQYLQQSGYGHQVGSPEYLDNIDDQIAILQGNRGLNMKHGNSPVSRVTRGSGASRGVTQNISKEQKDIARSFGMSDEKYMKRYMEQQAKRK